MVETRKLAAILAADVVGYSKLVGADEERTLARLRALRSDLIDPTIAVHHGRVVKRTGDGILIEFRSVVDAVRCAIEVQSGMAERNTGLPPDRRIEFRVGVHLGDVVEESDGDLMGDGVNIAARLEGIAKPSTIFMSEDAYRQVKSRLDLAVSDLGATQLKNITEPVRVYSVEVGVPAQAKRATATKSQRRGKGPTAAALTAVAVFLVLIATGTWYFVSGKRSATVATNAPAVRTEAAHLSIAVLPFTNLSGDPNQDYFADGITDNLTTELSRIRNSFVIARNTAFTFKGKNIPIKEISNELGVRYVLEGSVQRDQNRVRVNAQLIDGNSGAHLWADRFEESITDLFKLQDQVVARLANSLGYELVKAEASKSLHSVNPDAIDLTMRGWALLNVPGRDKAQHQQARELFERALEIDPQNAEAMVGVALIDIRDFGFRWGLHPERTLADSIALLTKALAIDPNFSYGYYAKGVALLYANRISEAMEAGRIGTIVDANSALSYSVMARAEGVLGHCEESLAHIKEAFRLSPRDPQSAIWHVDLGIAEFCRGRLDAAAAELRRAIDGGFRTDFSYAFLAAAEAQLGNDAEAKNAIAESRRLNPHVNLKGFRGYMPALTQVLEGLRKAGLPEE
jgi:adenylate cyclase